MVLYVVLWLKNMFLSFHLPLSVLELLWFIQKGYMSSIFFRADFLTPKCCHSLENQILLAITKNFSKMYDILLLDLTFLDLNIYLFFLKKSFGSFFNRYRSKKLIKLQCNFQERDHSEIYGWQLPWIYFSSWILHRELSLSKQFYFRFWAEESRSSKNCIKIIKFFAWDHTNWICSKGGSS